MYELEDFNEFAIDKQHSEIKISVRHIELSLDVKYFVNNSGVGYCSLLIKEICGKGVRGLIEAAAAKSFVGRSIIIFLSELDDGKKLVTVPALFEKEPTFNAGLDLSDLIIKTYYHDDLKKTPQEVYKEHMDALIGKKINNDMDYLCRSILELPKMGLEILRSYK